MRHLESVRRITVAIAAGLGLLLVQSGTAAQNDAAPRYKFDPDFPRPLPNKWKIGGVMGISIMADDSLWVYNRPNDLTNLELGAETTPPRAECCVRPPSMIHFDARGNVIGSFVAPQGHGMDTDSKGFAYLGQDTVRKYDVKTGRMVAEVPWAMITTGASVAESGRNSSPRSIACSDLNSMGSITEASDALRGTSVIRTPRSRGSRHPSRRGTLRPRS